MSLESRIKKLEAALKPTVKVKYVTSEDKITDEPHVIWVVFKY